MTYLESVAHALNQSLRLELLVPEAAMVTCFDGNGSHFVAHRDNACEGFDDADTSSPSAATACLNAREVTAIIYGNVDWDESQGGALRCHLGADEADGFGETATDVRDVAPHAGRLVLFKSRELLHEVLPSYGRRIAISLWLLDGNLPLRTGLA
jgi:Rps23 Pro-64 3,4-dihydroxylase Tpa1-like proline 4-hydroxylase